VIVVEEAMVAMLVLLITGMAPHPMIHGGTGPGTRIMAGARIFPGRR